jgi:uncharacterized surface protein with fasciclin (FAS1) repeats
VTPVAANSQTAGFISIIDILSRSAEFSILIRQLQRHDLVPLLNEATNVTFLAPTNAAFLDLATRLGEVDGNIAANTITRDRLLYHLLNETIFFETTKQDLVVPTFLDPKVLYSSSIKKTTKDHGVPIYVYSDKLRVGDAQVLESDLRASTGHGVVQVVDKLLDIPPSVCEILARNNETTIFSKIFKMEFNCSEPILPSYATVLAPTDSAFHEQLDPVELEYLLTSKHAENDRQKLLARHLLNSLFASPIIDPDNTTSATALDGTTLLISHDLTINDRFRPLENNVLANDGVIHYYNNFIAGTDGNLHSLIDFTPEKYFITLGAEAFVKELKFRGLEKLIQGQAEAQTVFLPLDEVDDDDDDDNVQEVFPLESTSSVIYHFTEGQYNLFDHKDGQGESFLLTTKYKHKKLLGNSPQRVKLTTKESDLYLNGKTRLDHTKGPFTVGKTTIYVIDPATPALELPPSLDLAAGSVYHSAESTNYLNDFGLLDLPSNKNGWTVLMPTSAAWRDLGLIKTYLDFNQTALEYVLKGFIFESPVYTNTKGKIKTTFLDGRPTTVEIKYDKKVEAYNFVFDGLDTLKLQTTDVLSTNGVVHSVDSVFIPRELSVSTPNVLESIESHKFLELLEARGFEDALAPGAEYTILAPPDKILELGNVTSDTPDIDLLLRLHLIPGNPIQKLLDDGDAVESLEGGVHLCAKELKKDLYLITIVEGDLSREVRVLNRGDIRTGSRTKTTILQVDKFLSPTWIIRQPSRSKLRTPVAIMLGVVFGGILIFGMLAVVLIVFLGRRTTAAFKNGSHESASPGERDPLLSRRSSVADETIAAGNDQQNYGSEEYSNSNGLSAPGEMYRGRTNSIKSTISENSVSEPIPTTGCKFGKSSNLGLPRV